MSAAIEATGLVKRYKKVTALDGLDLHVPEGTVLGLLGPNGAGKTTAVSILTTLLRPDAGSARVAGADVLTAPGKVRKRIGLSGQFAAVDENLTGFENLDMIGRLYHLGRATAPGAGPGAARPVRPRRRRRPAGQDLLRRHAPPPRPRRRPRRPSPRCSSSTSRPPGLDPRSRTEMWEVIRGLVGRGTTLLLTTQYLEEADQLADDIVVIDHGRVIAHGTADELKAKVGGERIEITVTSLDAVGRAREILARLSGGDGQLQAAVPHPRRSHLRWTARLPRSAAGARRGRHRRGRRRAAPAHPRRRVPHPHRPRRRARPRTPRPRRWRHERPAPGRGRQPRHRQAQRHQDQAGPRGPGLRPDLADHVRAAVRLRLRGLDRHPRRLVPRVPDRRDLRPDRGVRRHLHRRRPGRRHAEGHHRPLPVAAHVAGGGARRADRQRRRLQRPVPRHHGADRAAGRLAHPHQPLRGGRSGSPCSSPSPTPSPG